MPGESLRSQTDGQKRGFFLQVPQWTLGNTLHEKMANTRDLHITLLLSLLNIATTCCDSYRYAVFATLTNSILTLTEKEGNTHQVR